MSQNSVENSLKRNLKNKFCKESEDIKSITNKYIPEQMF